MALPQSMKVIEIRGKGGPEVLHMAERPLPQIGPDEVLIRVEAAGVNRPDVSQRQGSYPPPPDASDLPGLEVAGEIVQIGAQVSQWKTGDRVTALTHGGGYAEFCKAPANNCLPIPKGMDAIHAAGIPENWFTVWQNVVDLARLGPGESFMVHGGTSGIGLAAIQLAKVRGATAYATAGTDDKCRACEKYGAAGAVNYKTDWVAAFKQAPGGFDVILDMVVGGGYTAKNVDLLRPDGRLAMIAQLGGAQVDMSFSPILFKRLQLTGSTLRPRTPAYKAAIAANLFQHVWPAFESGRAQVVIDSVLPFAGAADAHRRMESSQHIGKIVLKL